MMVPMNIASLHDQNRYELVHTSLDLAEQSVSVFTHIYRDEALKTAAHADVMRMSRQPQSPLAGLPVSVKDLLDIAGEITMAGCCATEKCGCSHHRQNQHDRVWFFRGGDQSALRHTG
jgi:Asp-tRNA(Asn)/Glu-tRNA(Gln) amidotransferase A subunit family amidase